jgi:hypothetical protein
VLAADEILGRSRGMQAVQMRQMRSCQHGGRSASLGTCNTPAGRPEGSLKRSSFSAGVALGASFQRRGIGRRLGKGMASVDGLSIEARAFGARLKIACAASQYAAAAFSLSPM